MQVSAEVACGGDGGLSVEERKVIRRAHNVRRKKLAEGKETAHDGLKMKAASNILQMKYDCELENYAQNWINKCKFDHSPQAEREGKGENIYYYGTTGDLKDRSHYLRDAAKSWWNEVKNITNVTVGDKGLELTQAMAMDGALHWSQVD
ncbi:unnamed protein product [Anisakis simplex]|uniref:SCP domain-containing protein n=1 Tax=Anisakis simplex TaxID=6269 RepID=A0A0M3JXZ7_ANISI|nr:unnamed protein product [Anisakis simplex]